MKKIVKNVMLAGLVMLTFGSCDEEKKVSEGELPTPITNYISTHFPNSNILQSEYEKDLTEEKYEITLSDNIKLEFDGNNDISEIDGTMQLPDDVIPPSILTYVQTNYPNNYITDWELEDANQQVELDNGIELKFDMNGGFLKVDH